MHFVESSRMATVSCRYVNRVPPVSPVAAVSLASMFSAWVSVARPFAARSFAAWPFAAWSVAALCGAMVPGSAIAQAELTLVRDMLRLDAERALEAERNRAGRPAPRAAPAPVRQPDRIAVAAIYGVAGALRADVLVNGNRMHYQQGQPQARNATHAPGEFQLTRIDDLCVHLTRAAERAPRVVCYAAQPVAGPITGFTSGPSNPAGSAPAVSTPVGTAFGSSMSLPLGTPFPVSGVPSLQPR